MIYLKSLLIGLCGAIAAAVLWIVLAFVVPFLVPMLVSRLMNTGGASAAYIDSGSILLAAVVGFVVAAGLALRRLQRVR